MITCMAAAPGERAEDIAVGRPISPSSEETVTGEAVTSLEHSIRKTIEWTWSISEDTGWAKEDMFVNFSIKIIHFLQIYVETTISLKKSRKKDENQE